MMMLSFIVDKNKCKIGDVVVGKFDHIMMGFILFGIVLVLLLLLLVVTLAATKRCRCACDKKIDEIMSKQNLVTSSISTRRLMDVRNIANERVAQNARMMRSIDSIAAKLEGERE